MNLEEFGGVYGRLRDSLEKGRNALYKRIGQG
jgi:hypothetical protein